MNWDWDEIRKHWPKKFKVERFIFQEIRPGDKIFIGTGCGEPQYLAQALLNHVNKNPKAFMDAELINIVNLGVAPYSDEKFRDNFRLNSFFIGNSIRRAVNRGAADYTPIFLSAVPNLICTNRMRIDVALIQTTPPDKNGEMNLGVSVDIVKAAIERATLVVAQANSNMPRVPGDGRINIEDVDFIVPYDETLLEYIEQVPGDVARQIGGYVARIIEDGSTIQVGYGSIPNAIVSRLGGKKHLGIHTELLNDGIAWLMKKGVVDNAEKSINPGKTIATFCMGKKETYDFIDDNASVEFRTIDYTNNPLVIAQNKRMTAINSALEVDLTGQATAESIGKMFYSGIGGQADFMRGAVLAQDGKTILALPSTADDGSASAVPERGGRCHIDQGRYSLRGDGVRYSLPPRQEHQGAGHGSDSYSPPKIQTLAGRRGQEVLSDIQGSGVYPRYERRVSGGARGPQDHKSRTQGAATASKDQR